MTTETMRSVAFNYAEGMGVTTQALLDAYHAIRAVDAEIERDAARLAVRFHETYERLAPSFGYETRTETRAFDPTTPNGRLMIAVCGELLAAMKVADVCCTTI